MSFANQIEINSLPATISVNFEVLESALKSELEKYNIVVSEDTIAGAKELAADLNKTKAIIAERRKEAIEKASGPIKKFEASMKSLEGLCTEGRQRIVDQIAVFEDKKKALAKERLAGLLQMEWDRLQVRPDFRKAAIDDMVKLTAITSKGNLTAASVAEITNRAMGNKALQDQTDRRLLELENASYKAGLTAPLTKDHVKPFLFADDEQYAAELARIIDVEIHRQKATEAKIQERVLAQESARRSVIDEPSKSREQEREPTPEPTPEPPKEARPDEHGRIPVTVACYFEIKVRPEVEDRQIEAQARNMMLKAGVTTLKDVSITRQEFQKAG